MTYWDMQVHPGSRRTDFPVEKVRELLETSHLIGMGDSWENDLGQPDVFRREMEKGDVVVIRDGGNIVALVRIAGDCRAIPAAERIWQGLSPGGLFRAVRGMMSGERCAQSAVSA